MATRAQKKQRRIKAGSPVEQTKASSSIAAGGSLGRKTKGEVGASCAPNVLPEDAGKGELQKDAALISRSIVERWPTTHEIRTALRRRIQAQALKTVDDATLAKLATVDVRMEHQNLTTERLRLEVAGLIGSGRDPFEGERPATIQATQIHIHLPDNGRMPAGSVIEQDDRQSRTIDEPRKRRRRT